MSKIVTVRNLKIGGGSKIAVQSMTNLPVTDVDGTLAQIEELQKAGCDIVRIAVPDEKSAECLGNIRSQTDIPLVADIHFDATLAVKAMENGADKVRINPGNVEERDLLKVIDCAKERNCAIRVGVNSGSLEKELVEKYNGVTAEGIVESALDKVKIIEELG